MIKTIGNVSLVFLTGLAVIMIIALGYYSYFIKDKTIGTNYVGEQIGLDIKKADELSEEEINIYEKRYFMEANYYSNDNKNGEMLQELRVNYFMDYNLESNSYRSTGMQYVGDYDGYPLDTWDGNSEIKFQIFGDKNRYYGRSDEAVSYANKYVDPRLYYYDTTNGISWSGVTKNNGSIATKLNRESEFIINIDDKPFAINLTGHYDLDVGDVRNIFGIGWKVGDVYNRLYHTYGSVFESCMQAIETNDQGYGDYYITVDLSDFFTIKEIDENGKYKIDNVTDVIKNYSVLKFHYDENGAVSSSQSIFGSIEYNREYGRTENDVDTTYWQERVTQTIEEDSTYQGENLFEYRYSELYDGYFASLTMKAKKLFADMPRTKVNIELDLNSQYLQDNEINVVGFDYDAFKDFEIDTLKILGNTQELFVFENALIDTNLQTLTYSNGITFDFAENSRNNDFLEVVI